MEKGKMNYDLIYQAYQLERQNAALAKIDKDFYEKVGALIKELKVEYDSESKSNPSSTKCMLLYDELKKVRTLFREIYDYRIRKIALMALTGAGEGSVDMRGLADIETAIFEQLLATLKRSHDDISCIEQAGLVPPATAVKARSDAVEAPSVGTSVPETPKARSPSDRIETAPATEVVKVEAGPRTCPPPEPAPAKKKTLVLVQVLEDIPKFLGEGGDIYTLKKKDYVSLPKLMAERLEKQGKARIMPS